MSMQQLMRWGHDFPKDKGYGGEYLTFGDNGENPNVKKITQESGQPFLSLIHQPN